MKKGFLFILLLVVTFIVLPTISHAQTIHTVVRGDTLWKISVRYHVGLTEIIRANPQFKNPNLIYPGQKVTIPSIGEKSVEQQVISLTNQERAKHGLKPLTHDWELSRVARYKSMDMRDKSYFSHTSPTYGSPFTMMKNFGIAYRSAGENIAAGQTSAAEVVRAWMNSPGHRANILNQGYTRIGVGYAAGGSQRHYWTQMFISK
ncbi:LysM peptidoglycan-binding domain-containing protein [Neobacillus notoginsengisoli]|uniref:LysM peptidoglycan-binding domain-containing protein n=1 Tax=Neobacillus notoginsengisoli TaxID=1578198 RepID=A0A417YW23_9BACI|nr:SafA/ExsA family spore coat assembly protein [Neobacillus notoginsengisoli]RHW41536.1 LysM peptidoglycan-binding domain-containing protein [Neobacillus notoginsengisoli]